MLNLKTLTIIIKVFLIGLLLQFFLQTFVTYKLNLSGGIRNIIRAWKEIILVGLIGFLTYYFYKTKRLKEFWQNFILKDFILIFILTIFITFLVSIFINQNGLGTYIISIRYSMTGFLIFIVFFMITYIFLGTKEINLVKRYNRTIKTLLILSIARRGIIWLIPNLLKFAGYDQYSVEGKIGSPPPTTYYTQYNDGYARNQFLFERPISRGFFLVAFWPIFFILFFKNKRRNEIVLRGFFFGLAILSTFSRAARIARIIQTLVLIFLQFKKQFRKIGLYSFLPLLLIFGVVTYIGKDQIITREFSNTGHIKRVLTAFSDILKKPLRGQGAGSVGPASYQIKNGSDYNPENQFMQIWIEYGIFGFLGRMYLYLYLHWIGFKAYKDEHEKKQKIIKKTRFYGTMVFAFSLGLLGLSIEGMVLHSFVDRMIVYPFMALFGLCFAIYQKSLKSKN